MQVEVDDASEGEVFQSSLWVTIREKVVALKFYFQNKFSGFQSVSLRKLVTNVKYGVILKFQLQKTITDLI